MEEEEEVIWNSEEEGFATARRFLREAEEALQDEQNDTATAYAEKAAICFGRLPRDTELPGLIDCQRVRFQAMAQMGERKRALKLSKQELDSCLEAVDLRGEAVMRLCIAETVLEKMGSKHRKEAIPNATRSVAIFRDLEDDRLEAMSLLVIANAHLKRSAGVMDATKDSQIAVDMAKDALDLFRGLEDRRQEGLALHTISVGYLHMQEHRQAIQLCKKAIKIYEEIGARKLEAFERRVLARWHLRKDEPDQALEAAEVSLQMFRELEETRTVTGWQVAALGVVVEAYLAGKDFEAAIEAINAEMKLFEARGCKSSQASAQDMLREALLAKGDFEAAKEAAEKSVLLAKEVDKRMEAELLLQRAPLLGLAADANKAEESIREAVEIFKDLGAEKDRANALTMLAELHLAKREDFDALKCAQDAEKAHGKIGNTRGQAMAYLSAGEVHQSCGRVTEAETAFNESLAMCREGGDRKGEADSLTALSKLYGDSAQGVKAAEAAASALRLHRDLGRRQWILEALLHTARAKVGAAKELEESSADVAEIEQEVLSALELAREAVSNARRMDDAQSLIFCHHTEVEVLVAMNQFEEAMEVLKEAVSISQEQKLLREEGRLTSDVAQVYICQKNWKMATHCANKAMEIAEAACDHDGEVFAVKLQRHIESEMGGKKKVPEAAAPSPAAEVAPAAEAAPAPEAAEPATYAGPTPQALADRLQGMVMDMFDADELQNDTMLMDIGIDSLSMLDFHARIQREFPGVSWSTTMLFDHPTIGELANMMDDTLRSAFERAKLTRK